MDSKGNINDRNEKGAGLVCDLLTVCDLPTVVQKSSKVQKFISKCPLTQETETRGMLCSEIIHYIK